MVVPSSTLGRPAKYCVAQLGEQRLTGRKLNAFGYTGCGFDSRHNGVVAQLVEHLIEDQGVGGSSPLGPTK